jgi:Na+/H+ antiporter NhaD/arsenite permease-like protein
VAAVVALVVFGIPAAMQQHRHSPMVRDVAAGIRVDWARLGIVAAILISAVTANVLINIYLKAAAEVLPLLGLAVWAAIFATSRVRRPEWSLLPEALKGSVFLLSLVICASMMPVEQLPPASWLSATALGFVSAVFDNIPLTALALKQGGYDWGVLAFAVGFGGSMLWFGSSAGVALSNLFPEARSAGAWVRGGWHVPVGYVAGMAVLLLTLGWNPQDTETTPAPHAPPAETGSTSTTMPVVATTTSVREVH